MPIAQEKIDNFLNYVPTEPNPVKGVAKGELLDRIADASYGVYYRSKGPEPWPHQLEALTFCLERGSALLLIKVRRGKTKIALDWATQLHKARRIKRVLVIVPQPIVLEVWKQETPRHSALSIAIARTHEQLFEETIHGDSDIVAVHWSTLISYAKGGKVKADLDPVLLEHIATHYDAAIIDETHKCKNHKSVRFEVATTLLAKMQYKLGLTGTPFARNQFNLWAQVYLVDGGKALSRHYYLFEEAFGQKKAVFFGGRKGLVWSKKFKKLIMSNYQFIFDEDKSDLLLSKLSRIVISYGWEGAENLPELIHNVVDIPMSFSQKRLYNDQIRKVIDQPDDRKGYTFQALREIATGHLKFVDSEGQEHTVNATVSAKMEWLEEFLEEVKDSASILIVHEFIRSGELICETLDELATRKIDPIKLKYGHIKGGTKDGGELLTAFMQKKLTILVINWRSVSMGVDLSAADYQLFIETPVSSIDRLQVEARAVANRQGRPLFLDDLICAPVERKIIRFLKEGKGKLSDLVYRDDTFEMVEED
jgi:hypothetical protein